MLLVQLRALPREPRVDGPARRFIARRGGVAMVPVRALEVDRAPRERDGEHRHQRTGMKERIWQPVPCDDAQAEKLVYPPSLSVWGGAAGHAAQVIRDAWDISGDDGDRLGIIHTARILPHRIGEPDLVAFGVMGEGTERVVSMPMQARVLALIHSGGSWFVWGTRDPDEFAADEIVRLPTETTSEALSVLSLRDDRLPSANGAPALPRIPADSLAADLLARIDRVPGVVYVALVPNLRLRLELSEHVRAAVRNFVPVFVSRGVGTVYIPVRINCPPEVAILTLRPKLAATPRAGVPVERLLSPEIAARRRRDHVASAVRTRGEKAPGNVRVARHGGPFASAR